MHAKQNKKWTQLTLGVKFEAASTMIFSAVVAEATLPLVPMQTEPCPVCEVKALLDRPDVAQHGGWVALCVVEAIQALPPRVDPHVEVQEPLREGLRAR